MEEGKLPSVPVAMEEKVYHFTQNLPEVKQKKTIKTKNYVTFISFFLHFCANFFMMTKLGESLAEKKTTS